jgi:hypothetical protein
MSVSDVNAKGRTGELSMLSERCSVWLEGGVTAAVWASLQQQMAVVLPSRQGRRSEPRSKEGSVGSSCEVEQQLPEQQGAAWATISTSVVQQASVLSSTPRQQAHGTISALFITSARKARKCAAVVAMMSIMQRRARRRKSDFAEDGFSTMSTFLERRCLSRG